MHKVNNSTVKVGIIGVGNMGASHATRFIEKKIKDAELTAICDSDSERLKKFPDIESYTNADEMFDKADIDAVIIATPHYDHLTYGRKALEAGLHVLVEKPIAVHKADAERLIASYNNPDLVFAAMFNQRTDPRYKWVRDKIQDGTLGTIHRVNWIITDWFRTEIYYQNGDWRATWAGEGGGVLLNQCPHQLDLWQWMFGMPTSLRAFTSIGRFHNIEVEDDVTAYMKYENGLSGVFITTTGETPGTNRLEIAAENGRVVVEGNTIKFTRNTTPASEYSATTNEPFGRPETEDWTVKFANKGTQHVGILNNFIAAILGKEKLIAPASEGIHSVELGNAMLYSGLTDQTVVMPLDGKVYENHLSELVKNSKFVKKSVKIDVSADQMSASY